MTSVLLCLFLQEYLNTPRGTHAEIMFINDKSINRNLIKELWIKNSPCVHCSGALLDYFKKNHHKPTIYVGRIWHFNDKNDDQGLINLIKAGFKIEVWETLHDMMYGSDTRTKDYLRKLWEKMNKKQHKEL